MIQAIEAVCRSGRIVPLEPVQFEENELLVIVRMPAAGTATKPPDASPDWQHLAGLLRDSPNWNSDPQSIQETLRHEWD